MKEIIEVEEFCEMTLVFEYYDGPVEGIGLLKTGSFVYFKLIAWDKDQWQRVFAVTSIPQELFRAVWDGFSCIEEPKTPIWCPTGDSKSEENTRIAQDIEKIRISAKNSEGWFLVESHDLIGKSVTADISSNEKNKINRFFESNGILDTNTAPIIHQAITMLSEYK